MNKKRYAIVRADDRCPRALEKYSGLKCSPKGCDGCEIAKNYGDTKEQLIAKVEQAIRRNVKNGVCLYTENNYIHTTDNRFFWHWVAEFIVEFLGVEE